MDFSRLHLYTPPQCVPENTGYTYALSSSYSSDALDFETQHKLDPVFDSPRMSRRSLRLVASARASEDSQAGDVPPRAGSAASLRESTARTAKQRRSAGRETFSLNHSCRRAVSSVSQTSAGGLRPPVLDESLISEQTKVDHFWGLDDDGDLKGGSKVVSHGNGDLTKGVTPAPSNGYTCRDCSLLSERRDTLTARSSTLGPISRVYSRDRSQKRGLALCVDRTLRLARSTTAAFPSLLAQLFRVALVKLSYGSEHGRLSTHESRDAESECFKSQSHESKAHPSYCGRMNVTDFAGEQSHLTVSGASLCDDCKGETRRGTRSAVRRQSWLGRVMGALGLAFSCTGHLLLQTLQRLGATVWSVSRTVLAVLWVTLVTPGKAASGLFWWLGIGWYQLVTLVSWLNVFLLTRCLRNTCKVLILLLPLLLLLGAGLSLWHHSSISSFLPVLNCPDGQGARSPEAPQKPLAPTPSTEAGDTASHWHWVSNMEQQVTALSGQCRHHEQQLRDLTALLQRLQLRLEQVDSTSASTMSQLKEALGQQQKDAGPQTDFMAFHKDHQVRISNLEDALQKLTERSEAIQKELEQTRPRVASSKDEEQRLRLGLEQLQLELGSLRAQLTDWQQWKTGCEQGDAVHERVDASVRESLRLLFAEGQQDGALDWLLQKLSSHFVSKDQLQALLRDVELQILSNITRHLSVTRQAPTSETVLSAASGAGISGITEAQAHVIVNNALKLYSQDKTGLVDFALESGGGSILSTRCSETYETKTALISLFGIPLWYFSQSPRVVIQPDIYPGNCWAFRGSQGYLVVRLSMAVRPTAFTLEHVPKTLSPTGNITSAPKDFAVYGLDSEYQEEGQLLGQFTYQEAGESLQMFPVQERPDRAFQIVELRITSNWGHPEYTCVYRFRVHGEPVQ